MDYDYQDKIRAREWVECNEKPFVCIDADGDHLNVPTGILYDCRLSAPRRIRQAKIDRWLDRHPIFLRWATLLTVTAVTAVAMGYIATLVTHAALRVDQVIGCIFLGLHITFSLID
jgi:hypothetical protein